MFVCFLSSASASFLHFQKGPTPCAISQRSRLAALISLPPVALHPRRNHTHCFLLSSSSFSSSPPTPRPKNIYCRRQRSPARRLAKHSQARSKNSRRKRASPLATKCRRSSSTRRCHQTHRSSEEGSQHSDDSRPQCATALQLLPPRRRQRRRRRLPTLQHR